MLDELERSLAQVPKPDAYAVFENGIVYHNVYFANRIEDSHPYDDRTACDLSTGSTDGESQPQSAHWGVTVLTEKPLGLRLCEDCHTLRMNRARKWLNEIRNRES